MGNTLPQPPATPLQPNLQTLPQQPDSRRKSARHGYSRVGAACCLMLASWFTLTLALGSLVDHLTGGRKLPAWCVMLVNDIPLYCIAMPLAVLIMRRLPQAPARRFVMPAGEYMRLFIIGVPLTIGGNLIGMFLSSLISRGTAVNRLDTMAGHDWWVNIVFVVILAPLFEEWLFRRQIIGRLRVYGERTAVVVAALAFALFHVNLYQFFYTFALGLVFGYAYVRTSCLRYPVSMHMLVNANGMVLAPWIASLGGDDSSMMALLTVLLYGMAMLALVVAGIVLLIMHRKNFVWYDAPLQLPRGQGGRCAFLNPGMDVYLALSCGLTIAMLFL